MSLQFAPIKNLSARVDWDSIKPLQNVYIRVDNDKDGRIRSVIHELLHIEFYNTLEPLFNEELEEVVILALEDQLYAYVHEHPHRVSLWRRAIEEKLASQEKEEDGD